MKAKKVALLVSFSAITVASVAHSGLENIGNMFEGTIKNAERLKLLKPFIEQQFPAAINLVKQTLEQLQNSVNDLQKKIGGLDAQKVGLDAFNALKAEQVNNANLAKQGVEQLQNSMNDVQNKIGGLDAQKVSSGQFEQLKKEQNEQVLKLFYDEGLQLGGMQQNVNNLEEKLLKMQGKIEQLKNEKMQPFIDEVGKLADKVDSMQEKFDQADDNYGSLTRKIEKISSTTGKDGSITLGETEDQGRLDVENALFDMQKTLEKVNANQVVLKMRIDQVHELFEQMQKVQEREDEPIIEKSSSLFGVDKGGLEAVFSMLFEQKKRIDELESEKKKKDDLLDIFDRLDEQDKDGNTAMHRAVTTGKSAQVRALIGLGAAKNLKNNMGMSPYMLAQQKDNKEIVGLLGA